MTKTLLTCRTGSHAYGTAIPQSDLDFASVSLRTDPADYLGVTKCSHPVSCIDADTPGRDHTVYEFRKALELMLASNPTVLELVFADPEDILVSSKIWDEVIAHRDSLLTKRLRQTYGGYAFAQLKRIRSHRTWLLDPPQGPPQRHAFGLDARGISKSQTGAAHWLLASLMRDSVQRLSVSPACMEELERLDFASLVQASDLSGTAHALKQLTGKPDNYIDQMVRQKSFDAAQLAWESFCHWKRTRNPKRAAIESQFGYDTKHAMHLVRLLRMGAEILSEGVVRVRRPDAEELRAIRQGAWTFSRLEEWADKAFAQLEVLSGDRQLPDKVDADWWNHFCSQVIGSEIFGQATTEGEGESAQRAQHQGPSGFSASS